MPARIALGDLRAIPALLELGRDPKATEMSQALAIVALGMITDPEPRPSRVLMTTHANFPAATSALAQIYNIM